MRIIFTSKKTNQVIKLMIIMGFHYSNDMIFSELVLDLQQQLKSNLAQIRFMLKKNPAIAYTKTVEIGKEVGKKYNIKLVVNFPKEGRIEEFDMYGKRDLSLIIDYERK